MNLTALPVFDNLTEYNGQEGCYLNYLVKTIMTAYGRPKDKRIGACTCYSSYSSFFPGYGFAIMKSL